MEVMKARPSGSCSLSQLAQAAGLSKTAVSFALRNKPGVSATTRKRVHRLARELGYSPDPRLASMMVATRQSTEKEKLPLIWLNWHDQKNAWQDIPYLSPYLKGATRRASELGYYLEHIWWDAPGMTEERISQLVHNRGIEGIINTHYLRPLKIDWKGVAGVVMQGHFSNPRLPRVLSDYIYNMTIAYQKARQLGYERIGICLEHGLGSYSHGNVRRLAQQLSLNGKSKAEVPPLFYLWAGRDVPRTLKGEKQVITWLRKYRPEVVICHSNKMLGWAEQAGLNVPEDVGLIHLATDDDVADWAGIDSRRRMVGAAAVEVLVFRIQNMQFGLTDLPLDTCIRGKWHHGRTLQDRAKS